MSAVDPSVCDAFVLAQKVAELTELRGGSVADLRGELERLWLEFAVVDVSGERGTMKVFGRSPAEGEPELVAGLESARGELLRVEAEASAAVAAARGNVAVAQSRVDELRRGLVEEYSRAWRVHAEQLRQEAEDAGDETLTVPVVRYGGPDGAVETPELRYRRVVLAEEAAAADQKASWLDGYLARGDALDSQTLSGLVAEMVLPEAAETVAA
jgi:hypothetical protein